MKILKFLFLTIIFSCKTSNKEEIPNFSFENERNVEISINAETRSALETLSNTNLEYSEKCEINKTNVYGINFYFNITEKKKDLIILETLKLPCSKSSSGLNRSIRKYTIPIEKINYVYTNKVNLPSIVIGEGNYYVFIEMEFNNKSITQDYVTERGCCNNLYYNKNNLKEKEISIMADRENSEKIKNSINTIIKTLKNK
jgi:hypothetical protein